MILYLEDDGVRSRVGLVGEEDAQWVEGATKDLPICLKSVIAVMRDDHPTAIVAALTGKGRATTWSGVRAMTALGNAMGFAWGIPAVAVDVPEGTDDARLLAQVRMAAAGATKDAVLVAKYDGMPNITAPRV
jgi:hypothetical protein